MSAKQTPAQAYLAKVRQKPAKSEHHLQAALVKWCNGVGWGYVRDRFLAVPNGAKLGRDAKSRAIEMSRLKDEGLKPGAPDLIFWKKGAKTLWLEMKNGTDGRLSEPQKVMHGLLAESDFTVRIARDLAGAVEIVIQFYTDKL